MKTSLTISILVAVLVHFQTSIAFAQGKPPGAGGARGGHGGGKSALFTALDANGDGAIDAAELANASVALKKLDKNGDGKIAEDEAAPAGGPGMAAGGAGAAGGGRPGMRGRGAAPAAPAPAADANNPAPAGGGKGRHGRPASPADTTETVNTLMSFDKNADGKLSRDEVPERMQGLFDRCDKNKDGFLTGDELKAAADEQSKTAGAPAPAGKGRRPAAK